MRWVVGRMAGSDAGLGARLASAHALLAAVVNELDPDCLTGDGAAELYGSFAGLERLSMAGKTLVARRVEASGVWRDTGHRDAATMLAEVEGVSPGQARTTLAAGRRLEALPGTEDVLRAGRLSAPKVAELTGAGILDPARESDLLEGADELPLYAVRERCNRSRATSGSNDPLATVRRIRAGRHFSSWTDPEGAFCYQGRDTADRGAQILSHLGSVATRLRRARAATDPENTEPERALRADAFFALVTRRHPGAGAPPPPGPRGSRTSSGPRSDPRDGPDLDPDIDPDTVGREVPPGPDGTGQTGPPGSLIDRPPVCSVVVRVDLAALLRGHAEMASSVRSTTRGRSPCPWPGTWPTTRSCASSSTRPATSGPSPIPGGPSTATCAPPWSTGTPPVWCPAAGSPSASRSTTWSPSPRAAPPNSTILPSSATTTISSRPTRTGSSPGWARQATAPLNGPSLPHPPSGKSRTSGSTPKRDGTGGTEGTSERRNTPTIALGVQSMSVNDRKYEVRLALRRKLGHPSRDRGMGHVPCSAHGSGELSIRPVPDPRRCSCRSLQTNNHRTPTLMRSSPWDPKRPGSSCHR